jgi:BirA family biotin operon repressor/biotin-[acetyl-CoA-carboxylase] ligase
MNTALVAREYQIIPKVDSTNNALKTLLAEQKVPEGFCLLTNYQTSGRGQYGKQWHSEAGQNLLMSLYLEPKFLQASDAYRLTMSVCLALHDLGNELGFKSSIKWPNDWFFGSQKIAGILMESTLKGANLESCIVGIGLNVKQVNFGSVEASSINSILNTAWEPEAIFKKLAFHLDERYRQLRLGLYKLQHREFEAILHGLQEEVQVVKNGDKKWLRILGVEASGRLKVRWYDGAVAFLQHQEVQFVFA